VLERRAGTGRRADVAVKRPQALHPGSRRVRSDGPSTRARGHRCSHLPREDLSVEERDDDRLGEGLGRSSSAGRGEYGGARATHAEHRAVRRVLEGLEGGGWGGGPVELSEGDGGLTRNRDAHEVGRRARRRASWWRSGRRERGRGD